MKLHDAALEGECLQNIYQVDEKIGKGGMAWVYRGHHARLGGQVAIKILFSVLQDEAELRERFLREAQVQYGLDHPHIVRVLDFIEDRDVYGFVCEWCDLGDLKSYVDTQHDGILPLEELVRLAPPILDALTYAHAQGVIHRDLKPSNILLSQTQAGLVPKVSDFGIAKLLDGEGQTTTGSMLGTIRFASPEQAQDSKHIDQRADVYSFGVMLYVLLTGRYPFNGTAANLYLQILAEDPPPPTEAPEALHPVIYKCLAKDANDRYPDCYKLQLDLLAALDTLGVLSPALQHRRQELLQHPPPTAPSVTFPSQQQHALQQAASHALQRSQAGLATPVPSQISIGAPTEPSFVAPPDPPAPPAPSAPPRSSAIVSSLLTACLMLLAFIAWQNLRPSPAPPTTPPHKQPKQPPPPATATKRPAPPAPQGKQNPPTPPTLRNDALKRPTPSILRPGTTRSRPPQPPSALRPQTLRLPSLRRLRPRRPRRARRRVRLSRRRPRRVRKSRPTPARKIRRRRGLPWWYRPGPPPAFGFATTRVTFRRLMRLSMYHGTDVDKHVGRLCKAGYGEACASVARLLRLQRKIKQANQTYRKACRHSKHKSLYACATWGLMFVGRWSAAIRLLDKRKGCSLFIETCEKGYSKGCSYVNQYDCLPQRIRVPRQSTHKEPFQDNILRVRLNARALFQLAEFVRYRRSDRAVEQYVFACRKHSADACRRVHAHHTWRRNAPVALRFLKKACRLHSPDSCRKLAGIYLGRYRSQGYTEVKSKRIACLAFHMAAAARRTRKLNPWYEGRLLRKYKCPPPP